MTGLPLYLLKRHPIVVEAHFEWVLVLTYAFPSELLAPLLSPGLVLDTCGDKAFVAVAIVSTRKMRPRGWPEFASRDYVMVGYRIFVRYKLQSGRRLRGLKILRSDASNDSVVHSGNLFTHYNFKSTQVDWQLTDQSLKLSSKSKDHVSDMEVTAKLDHGGEWLPEGSPFTSVRDALKFAGPMPFTFDYEKESNSIIRVEGVRQEWHPHTVPVEVGKVDFFKQAPFCNATPLLCSAFFIKDVPYYWKSGIVEKIAGNGDASGHGGYSGHGDDSGPLHETVDGEAGH